MNTDWTEHVVWTRKPNTWEEIRVGVKRSDLPEDLPILYPYELWGLWTDHRRDLMESFIIASPQYFILHHDRVDYLVNTETYQYCRYVAKVEED